MKYFLALFMAVTLANGLMAQEVIKLYEGKIPGSKPVPADYKEETQLGDDGVKRISKVSSPSFTVYLPAKEKATGAAAIICPGGGYGILAIDLEGTEVAKRFNDIGVAAFVLKYRLPSDLIMEDKSFGPLMDAQQAIYLVRKNAAKWNINPNKVGIMGFSAGGHMAASLTVHYNDVKIENVEKLNLRPDFSMLIYPVISFVQAVHKGTSNNLIGPNGSQQQKDYFSNEKHVTPQTPPTFLVQANDDYGVPVLNSILFDEALVNNKVKAEMHLYQNGGHGFGVNNKTTPDDWFERLSNWMRANKFL